MANGYDTVVVGVKCPSTRGPWEIICAHPSTILNLISSVFGLLHFISHVVLGLTQSEVLALGFIFARYSLWLSHGCILVRKGSDLEDLR